MINRGQWGYGADFFVKIWWDFGRNFLFFCVNFVLFCVKLRELEREGRGLGASRNGRRGGGI